MIVVVTLKMLMLIRKMGGKWIMLVEKKEWNIMQVFHKAVEVIALIMLGIGIGRYFSC